MNNNDEFTLGNARRMHAQGLEEEKQKLIQAPLPPTTETRTNVVFTSSGNLDWTFLAASRFAGASAQPNEVLSDGLRTLRSGLIDKSTLTQISEQGFVFHQQRLCWIIRHDAANDVIVVHGITQLHLNPFRRIWRYFDQMKAIDLLETREIYLRRVDRLDDPFEARPTQSMEQMHAAALQHSLGGVSPDHLRLYDNIRRALFVCCWQKSEE